MKTHESNHIRYTSLSDLKTVSNFFDIVDTTDIVETQYKHKDELFMIEQKVRYFDVNKVLLAETIIQKVLI